MSLKIGNNNKIKNSNLVGGSQTIKEKEKSKEGFWKQILNSVISNALWWIISIIIIAILGYFGLKVR